MKENNNNNNFDIIVMGGGIAGISACLHLVKKIPEFANGRIALIDPRSMERNNLDEDYKVGESTIEVSAMFFSKELGLQDYLIENHTPKFTLQYHWPKDIEKTSSMNDFYSQYSIKSPSIQSFHFNRSKLERDLLKMVLESGVVYYHGKVINVDLTPGNEIKTVDVQLLSNEINFYDQKPLNTISITAKYLIDASGRSFIIGSRTDNILKDPKDIEGLENGSSWLRVKNTNDKLIYDVENIQNENCSSSIKYCTDHFLGKNYWIWKIPIESGSSDYSIGISYNRNEISPTKLNSKEKFLSFLKSNCKICYDLIESGEIVDFHRWPRIAHKSKTIFSHDNWCVIGDAAAIFDPFYSTGLVMTSFQIEMLTKLLQFKFQENNEKEYKNRTDIYNVGCNNIIDYFNHLVKDLHSFTGNASSMSWRLYFEVTTYFHTMLPIYIGKFFLCPDFLKAFDQQTPKGLASHKELLNLLQVANDKNLNIGFMHIHLQDALLSKFTPNVTWDHDDIVTGAKYGYKQLNIFKIFQWRNYYQGIMISTLYYRIYGVGCLFKIDFLKSIGYYTKNFLYSYTLSLFHSFGQLNKPNNSYFHQMRTDFKSYKYKNQILDW